MAAVLALVSSILWGSADFGGGLASRRLPAMAVVGCSQAAALVVAATAVLALGIHADPAGWLVWSMVAGLSGVSGLACFYQALSIGTMGVVSPIAALGVVVPVVVSLVAGDRPSIVQYSGMALAVVGAVTASGPELSGSSMAGPAGRRSVLLAVVSGALFGLCQLGIARGAQESPLLTLLGMRVTSAVAFAVVVMAGRGRLLRTLRPRDVPLLIAVGVADMGANLLFALSTTMGLISIVAVLGALYPVMTVLLARFVLGERLLPIQVTGVGATLAGVAMLSLG